MPAPNPNDDEAAISAPIRLRLSCPECGHAVRRRRRSVAQRWLLRGQSVGRYRCASAACGWTGLLAREVGHGVGQPPSPRRWSRLALRGLLPLALTALAAVAFRWGGGIDGGQAFVRARSLSAVGTAPARPAPTAPADHTRRVAAGG